MRFEDLCIQAQQVSDDQIASQLLEECRRMAAQAGNGDLDFDVAAILAVAKHIADQTGLVQHHAYVNWCEGVAYREHEPKRALLCLERAAEAFEQLGFFEATRIRIVCISVYTLLGQYQRAELVYAQCVKALQDRPNYQGWPTLHLNGAFNAEYLGQDALAFDRAALSAQAAQRLGRIGEVSPALINQAHAALRLLRFEACTKLLDQIDHLPNLSANKLAHGCMVRFMLCVLQDRLFEGLLAIQQADHYYKQAQAADMDFATVRLKEAEIYLQLHLPVEAHKSFQLAAQIFERIGIAAECAEAQLGVLRHAASAHLSAKRLTHALQKIQTLSNCPHYFAVFARAYQYHPVLQKNKAQRAVAIQQLAFIIDELTRMGKLDFATEAGLMMIQLLAHAQKSKAVDYAKNLAQQSEQAGLQALAQKAWGAYAALVKPAQALPVLRHMAQWLDQQRRAMPQEALKAMWLSGERSTYTQLIETELSLGQMTQAAHHLLQAKGGVWADLAIRPAQPDLRDDDMRRAIKKAQVATQTLRLKRMQADGSDLIQAQLDAAQADLVKLNQLRTSQLSPLPVPTVADVQAALRPDEVLIDFFHGSSHIQACILTARQAPVWLNLCETAWLGDQYEALLMGIQLQKSQFVALQPAADLVAPDLMLTHLARLAERLLHPFEAQLKIAKRLVIVPDELMFNLPWFALIRVYAQAQQWVQPPEVVLLPSAAQCALPRTSQIGRGAFVFGHSGTPPLAHVQTEVEKIAQLLPQATPYFPAHSADVPHAFATHPASPRYLHFAMHGSLNQSSPLLSHLQFADGPMDLSEVLRLPLQHTELVTLSACDTATMPERGGVAMAYAGAFLCAGAQGVLASLWQVNDAATSQLMFYFYEALMTGLSAARALFIAQGRLIAAGYSHAYYWAGFQVLQRSL